MTVARQAPRPRPKVRELAGFVAGTAALFAGVAAAVVGGFVVPFVVSHAVTAVVTGWTDPGPEIIQGCETSLMCSEPGPFMITWAVALVAYVVVATLAFRTALNRWRPSSAAR